MRDQHGQKRRKYARHPHRLPLVVWDDLGHIIDVNASMKNVGSKGFAFSTLKKLKEHQLVRFEMTLPTAIRVKGSGRLSWVKNDDYETTGGVAILDLPWRDTLRFYGFLHGSIFDWAQLIEGSAYVVLVVILAFMGQDIVRHHFWILKFLGHMLPLILVVAFAGMWILSYMRQRR